MKNSAAGIKVANRRIGPGHPVFIVAEMSGNHNQSLKRALEIVDAAAKAGAHAIKLQTYTAETMTLNISKREFIISDPRSLWKGSSLYQLYQKAFTPWEWHRPIFKRCRELGMIGFSTPFDETSLEFLESLDVPCYKVAAFENTDIPLIRKIALTGKPMIISTGMATAAELDESVRAARIVGCQSLVLLKCVSAYPASPDETNLMTLPHMSNLFRCPVGLSDHTLGMGVGIASVAMGASIIEKHFTLKRSEGGVDAAFSLEPAEFQNFVTELERAQRAIGEVYYGPTDAEKGMLLYRRSLYVSRDIKAGNKLSKSNLRAIRPGLGLPPKYFEMVIGKKVKRDIVAGTPLTWHLLE